MLFDCCVNVGKIGIHAGGQEYPGLWGCSCQLAMALVDNVVKGGGEVNIVTAGDHRFKHFVTAEEYGRDGGSLALALWQVYP